MVAVSGGWRGGGGGRGGRKETRSKEGGSLPSPLGGPEPWVTFCPSFSGTDCPGNLSWGEEGEEERRNTANFLHRHPLPSLPLFFSSEIGRSSAPPSPVTYLASVTSTCCWCCCCCCCCGLTSTTTTKSDELRRRARADTERKAVTAHLTIEGSKKSFG